MAPPAELEPMAAVADGAAGADGGTAAAEDEATEDLLKDAENALGELFPMKAPRDLFAGLWSGTQCVLSGLFLGVAGLVTQPYEGWRGTGLRGCCWGFAVGTCTGLFFSVTGFCVGAFQALRGVFNTPRALCMVSRGLHWDREACHWAEPVLYSLPEEADRVLANDEEEEDEDIGGGGSGSRRRVAETHLYDQLCVTPSASQRDIRQAYFLKSRQWHPDKTSAPRAKEKFQAISEAYQVLSDPARRRAYDAHGQQGAGEGFIDAQVFFSVLLGADALEPYIGRLRIGEMFGQDLFNTAEGEDGGDNDAGFSGSLGGLHQQLLDIEKDDERQERRQTRRQVRLAVSLAERLEPYVKSESSNFREDAHKEARGLLEKDASTERFMAEIGWVYKNRAEWYLARRQSRLGYFGLHALHLRLLRRGREARQQANTAKLAIRSFLKLRKIVNEADETTDAGSTGEDSLPNSLNSALPTFMETLWSLSAHDITGTLDKVINRTLKDGTLDAEGLRRRAEGLKAVGHAFISEAEAVRIAAAAAATSAESGGGADGAGSSVDDQKRKRFEEAFIASMGAGGRPSEE